MACQPPCAVKNCDPALVAMFRFNVSGALKKLDPISAAELDAVKFDVSKLSTYGSPLMSDEHGNVPYMDIVNALVALMESNESEKAAAFFGDAMKLSLILTNYRKDGRIEELEDALGSKELALKDALDALALSSRDDLEAALKELEKYPPMVKDLEALVESMKQEIATKDQRILDMKEQVANVHKITVAKERAEKQVVQLTTKLEAVTELLAAKAAELERSEALRHDAIAKLARQATDEVKPGWEFSFCSAREEPAPPAQPYDLNEVPTN